MTNIDYFRNILNPIFISDESSLNEMKENMKIDLDKRGCNSILFKFDKDLGKEYKGGIFPFFNKGEAKVCKVCDYIIFAETAGNIFALLIELKKGKEGTNPQLKAGECFSNYVNATVNRVYDTQIKLIIRKIAIHEFKIKRNTKPKPITYDENNMHHFRANKFFIKEYLK